MAMAMFHQGSGDKSFGSGRIALGGEFLNQVDEAVGHWLCVRTNPFVLLMTNRYGTST
jgi:hypothetical protein